MKAESPHPVHVKLSDFSGGPVAQSFSLPDGRCTPKGDSPSSLSLTRRPLHLQVPGSASTYPVSAGSVFSTNDGHAPGRLFAWPSPSLGPGSMDNGPCYSISSTSVPNNALMFCNMNTPISPDACSSAGSTFSPAVPMDDLHMCTPASDISPVEPEGQTQFPTPPIAPRRGPSVSAIPDLFSPEGVPPALDEPPHHVQTRGQQQIYSSNMQKMDEPYAKLIYRAFMSRPDYSMTLQDLYQWFRENTNKAVNEKGGWQNSIRHNLSMNGAFTKPKDRLKSSEGGVAEGLAESKRSTKWVLADWAVEEGVKSTTRYRKQSSGRRNAPKRQVSSHPYAQRGQALDTQALSPRAQSGRKGGCAARNFRQNRLNYARSCGPHDLASLHSAGPVQRPLPYSMLQGDAVQMASLDQQLRGDGAQDGPSTMVNPMYFMAQQQPIPYDMTFGFHGYNGQSLDGTEYDANMFSTVEDGLMIEHPW